MHNGAAWGKAAGVAAVAVLGITVGAWAQEPEQGQGTGRCSGGEQEQVRRPRSFEPHVVGLAGAVGFAVNGCFPGDGPANAAPQQGVDQGGAAAPGSSGDAGTCAGRTMDNFGLNVALVVHPPLTPEERGELQDLTGKCGSGSGQDEQHQRLAELQQKDRCAREARNELRVGVNVGMGFYTVDALQLGADDADAGQPTHCVTLDAPALKGGAWRPWDHALRPLHVTAALHRVCDASGQVAGTLDLQFGIHQMRPTAFGCVQLTGQPPLWVMAVANTYHGRAPRPAWHHWCKPGHEEEGGWNDDGNGNGAPKPTPTPTPTPTPPAKTGDGNGNCNNNGTPKPPANTGSGNSNSNGTGNGDGNGGGNGNSNSNTQHGNNGVGNGTDPQPPGNPPVNDGPGTGPGTPGNKGGSDGKGGGNDKGSGNDKGGSTGGSNGKGNGNSNGSGHSSSGNGGNSCNGNNSNGSNTGGSQKTGSK